MPPERVFLVPSGYNFRAVLAFCRALRRAGVEPAVIACTAEDPIFQTRYARAVVFTRSSRTLALTDFAAAIQAARIRSGALRCVLAPTSEFLVRWAYRHREQLGVFGCDLPLPDEAAYLTVTDKAAFTAFARNRGLPVPREFAAITPDQLPAVAKPRWNVSPDGRSLYPWLLRTHEDLIRFTAQEKCDDYFFQEWVLGRSYYLFFHIPTDGEPTVFSQENLAQQPGGKSILLARGAKLHETPHAGRWADALRAAGFHGVAMVELRGQGSDFKLIEANPRLWGPLQLCLDGCPALLMNYIAEQCRITPPAGAYQAATASASYLWLGGLAAGSVPDWHGEAPRFASLRLWRHVASDVYLQGDSWRYFFSERRPAPAVALVSSVPRPVVPVTS